MAQHNKISILFTCVGRRVSLVNSFQAAANALDLSLTVIGADVSKLSPALHKCDQKYIVEKVSHPDYISQILRIVEKENISLLIPTVDLDLKILAKYKSKFADIGCTVLVSDPDIIDICQDKCKTYRFLIDNSFETPSTSTAEIALENKDLKFPCFLKPADGYASRGTAVVENFEELVFFAKRIPNCICQDFTEGDEITCDVYVDFNMNPRCVVPRQRLEVRSGEVSKGRVIKRNDVMEGAAKVIKTLKAGPGVITIQLFITPDNCIVYTEINPRFGGGAPLSIKAGADFPKWILQELTGQKPDAQFDQFTDQLTMLRYDSEVWI
jgi:carbamoyl-phosphate synthase large subunit